MAVAKTIIALVKKAVKKPSALKALAKYTGRQVLRRTGVFGTYGTLKKYIGKNLTKTMFLKKITTSIIKKNFMRSLGPMNFTIDIFKKKGGVKYALKQFGGQKMTPMAVKKVGYLYQNYQQVYGGKNPILQQSKREMGKELRMENNSHTPMGKLNQIEGIMNTKGVPERVKQELLNDGFRFKVKSPESHNFNRTIYKGNPKTGELFCSIRSGGNHRIYNYMFVEPDIQMIKKMVRTGNYGRNIFWGLYH